MFGYDVIGIRSDKLAQYLLKNLEIIVKNSRG